MCFQYLEITYLSFRKFFVNLGNKKKFIKTSKQFLLSSNF